MTAPSPDFRLAQPGSIKEAIAAFVSHPGSRFIAGGTDLIVNMRRGISRPDLLVDLSGIDELNEIKTNGHGVTIGAGVTIATLARNTAIAGQYRALAQAAAAIAGPGHRNMGTVSGNLCLDTRCIYYNQSEWWRNANAYCLKIVGMFVMLPHRDGAVTPPTVAILRPLCSFLAPKLRSPAHKAITEFP